MNLEQAAIDYAKNVVECNPDAKNVEGLIHTAVIYGASHITVTEGMTFGQAIRALKEGKKVRRENWPEGIFLWLKPAAKVKAEWCQDPLLKSLAEKNGGVIDAQGTICAHIDGTIVSGFTPMQEDMLAEDWNRLIEQI
ncbi:MAG: DUF2829 domain-containing protein [Muribaculum sp.]|nr:DUF2829 domain-containing protein [Muribaculum sp.]